MAGYFAVVLGLANLDSGLRRNDVLFVLVYPEQILFSATSAPPR
jgi:hypothetical protein